MMPHTYQIHWLLSTIFNGIAIFISMNKPIHTDRIKLARHFVIAYRWNKMWKDFKDQYIIKTAGAKPKITDRNVPVSTIES